jgi:hypothetical protein
METEFNLPGSSYEEIHKIMKGYSHASENASLDGMSKLTGLHHTAISRNNKFLSDIGLITGGMKKTATDLGKHLGRALDHNQTEDCRRYWKEAVQTNEKMSALVTTVRIKDGMSEKEFTDHILYVSGQKNNSGGKTGARCVVDVLLTAALLEERDGKLLVTTPPVDSKLDSLTHEGLLVNSAGDVPIGEKKEQLVPLFPSLANRLVTPQIAINIQLQLPETENAEVYENCFERFVNSYCRQMDNKCSLMN